MARLVERLPSTAKPRSEAWMRRSTAISTSAKPMRMKRRPDGTTDGSLGCRFDLKRDRCLATSSLIEGPVWARPVPVDATAP
jgi:hypothetical protein